ncbi:MFS general substrate transporter [Marasmius fiardii PR-910]|nr:MFS general substrate transporter [Marasmius fiardii PR-910]
MSSIDIVQRTPDEPAPTLQENDHKIECTKEEELSSPPDSPEFPKFENMPALKIAAILFSLGLAMFLFAIEQTIVATSVSSIGEALNIKGSLTWISTAYLLTTTVAQPITGRIADAVGVKKLLIIELWIFVIGNIISGTAKGLGQIIAGRLIAGIGGAGLLTLSCIVITQLTHERQRASYMNLINVVFIFADSLGPIVGGALANSGNWRWLFLLNAPFAPVITIILFFALRLPRTPSPIRSFRDVLTKVDLFGMFLLVSALSFIIIALNSGGQTASWDSPMVIGLIAASGVSFILFWIAEKYAKMPVAPTRLFVKWEWRNVPLSVVMRTLLFFHIFAITFYLPIFLQVIGLSTIVASALIIPFLFMAAIASTVTNEMARLFDHVRLVYTGGLLLLPVGLGLMSSLNETSSLGRIVGYTLIAGAGFGSGTQLSMVIAQAGVPADELSTVTALIASAPTLGGTLGVAAIGTVINNVFQNALFKSPTVGMYTTNLNISINANDVVNTVHMFPEGSAPRAAAVRAYVFAWRRGIWTLLGISGVEILMCLILRRVELATGRKGSGDTEKKDSDPREVPEQRP